MSKDVSTFRDLLGCGARGDQLASSCFRRNNPWSGGVVSAMFAKTASEEVIERAESLRERFSLHIEESRKTRDRAMVNLAQLEALKHRMTEDMRPVNAGLVARG